MFYSQINHAHLIKLMGICVTDDQLHIVMEYVEGKDFLKAMEDVSIAYLCVMYDMHTVATAILR